ncbi:MAG: spore germination protein [Armatimonadetes bacterium]|nr:spore germination protein [Armatimonadota bacterium]
MPVLFSPSFINLFGFKVNFMDHNSVINLGPSCQFDLNTFTKGNTGSGSTNGDLPFSPAVLDVIFDNDFADAQETKISLV